MQPGGGRGIGGEGDYPGVRPPGAQSRDQAGENGLVAQVSEAVVPAQEDRAGRLASQ